MRAGTGEEGSSVRKKRRRLFANSQKHNACLLKAYVCLATSSVPQRKGDAEKDAAMQARGREYWLKPMKPPGGGEATNPAKGKNNSNMLKKVELYSR